MCRATLDLSEDPGEEEEEGEEVDEKEEESSRQGTLRLSYLPHLLQG